MREPGPHPQHPGLHLVERENQEGPVEEERPTQGDGGGDQLAVEVALGDAGDRAEEHAGEIAHIGARLAGHDDHGKRQHPDEQQTDGGVLGERGVPAQQVDAAHHAQCRDERAQGDVPSEHEGDGDAREHAVRQGVTEEAESAQDDPCADDGRGQHCQEGRRERAAHERVG